MIAKPRQQEAIDKAYMTKQQPNQMELVGSGRFWRKLQIPKVFDEMLVAFLNSEKSLKFTIAFSRYNIDLCPVGAHLVECS
jgi:hypothetical protein